MCDIIKNYERGKAGSNKENVGKSYKRWREIMKHGWKK